MNIVYEKGNYWIEENEDLQYGYWVCYGDDMYAVSGRFETMDEALDHLDSLLVNDEDDEKKKEGK